MTKVTLTNSNQRGDMTYKSVALDQFAEAIRTSVFLRGSQIPRVCFGARLKKHNEQPKMMEYNALVLLEVDNLPDRSAAEKVRELASKVPYTLLAYIGINDREVKIVCRIQPYDGVMPEEKDAIQRFHTNGFARLHYIYSNDLHMTVENRRPSPDRICNVGFDRGVYYNPDAQPMLVSPDDHRLGASSEMADGYGNNVALLPGMDMQQSMRMAFEACLAAAYDKLRLMEYSAENQTHQLASVLADKCRKCGLPKMVALDLCRFKAWYEDSPMTVNTIFDNAYAADEIPFTPSKAINKVQLMTMKVDNYLRTHVELRRNDITKELQFRDRRLFRYDWRTLTDEDLNEITHGAMLSGINVRRNDMQLCINRAHTPTFNPIEDWIFHLPKWDGTDRVAQIISGIPTDDTVWHPFMRTWLRSMVAHWMGKDSTHGNALMPVLIGYQGCGKTTFCSMLLPPEMRNYYTDRIDIKNDTTIQLALSRYALINIDEFDQIKKGQQPLLKFLISTAGATMRLPFTPVIEERRRYASFIATTNNLQPLVDTTGSRRFLCIKVTGTMARLQDLDHAQLYAQLLHEIDRGERYWLNEAETAILEEHNARYMRADGLRDIILSLFRLPRKNERCRLLTTAAVIRIIKERLPNFKADDLNARRVGGILTEMGARENRNGDGTLYKVISKD